MITLNFDEVLKRIYNAKKGVEVRYGLGQGFEYCKQFADEAQGYATNAKASADKAEQTVAGIEQTKTDAVQAVQNAQTTATTAVQQAQSTATTAVTTKQTEAVQAVDDERDAALQQVADSTQTAQTAASNAAASEQAAQTSKEAAASAAGAAANYATAASGSASTAATSENNAASSAENSEASAARSEAAAKKAEAVVSTDKTLAVPGAPADAAAVGNIILDPDGNAIFYSKAEVEAKIKEILAAQREEDLAKVKFWVSNDPTSPASFIGGTWERIEDCTIWGASDTHPAGTTVEAGLPNITGGMSGLYNEMRGEFGALYYSEISNATKASSDPWEIGKMLYFDASRSNSIYGASNTVQPPAYSMYIWRRVA
jgi:hypothetical protein